MSFLKSQKFLVFLGMVLLFGVAALEFFVLVPEEIVLPPEILKNQAFDSRITGKDSNFDNLKGYRLPDTVVKDIRRLLLEYKEVDPRNGTKSVLKTTLLWVARFVAVNYLYIIPVVFMSAFLGVTWGFVSVVLSLLLFGFTTLFRDMPMLLVQYKALFVYFANDTEIAAEIASRLPLHFESLEAFLKYEAGIKVFVFAVAGIFSGLLSDRRSMNFIRSLEESRGEMLKLQAQLGQSRNAAEELKKLDQKLFKLSNRLAALQTLTQVVGKALNPDEVCKESLEAAVKVIGAQKAALYLKDPATGEVRVKTMVGWSPEDEKERSVVPPNEGGLLGACLKEPKILSAAEMRFSISSESGPKFPSVLCASLVSGDRVTGAINIELMENQPTQEDTRMLSLIASLTAVANENAVLFAKTQELANTDGLTKLYTHRYFQNFFEKELEKCKRYSRPLAIIMTDIDHFKKFNDTYGHQIGDLVLEETAKVLKNTVRSVDLAARYGGEEFIAVLPETDYKGAYALAERLRKSVESKVYRDEKTGLELKVTISVGIASFPLHSTEKLELIKRADEALYHAKEEGRNRCKVAPISKEKLAQIQQTQKKS